MQFIARHNEFYFQFQKLANNYNQIVKVVNAPSGALYYNKEKVDKDKAEVLFGQKMLELFDKYGQWMLYLD